jgi:translation initiation factor IF-3
MAKKENKLSISFKINDEIKGYDLVRIVGDNIESKVVSLSDAKKLALSMGLDLVEFNTKPNPPIMKICNYDKLIYELKKNEKKKKQNSIPIKEVQLSVNIATHDIETKAKQSISFLSKGHKVKVILTMKGRELTRREESKKSLLEFLVMMEDYATIESLKDEGNKTIAIIKKK